MLKDFKGQLEYLLICVVAFVLPLNKKLIPWAIVLLVIGFVAKGGFKRLLDSFKERYVWIAVIFYMALVAGLLYSENQSAASFDLEVKVSLLLFPLVLSSIKLSKEQLNYVFVCFIFGCVTAIVICSIIALLFFLNTHDTSVFFYNQLSVFQHPSYFSMYLSFSIYILYYNLIVEQQSFIIKSRGWKIALIILFSLFIVLLSSKMGIISLMLVIVAGTVYWMLSKRDLKQGLLMLATIAVTVFITIEYFGSVQDRFRELVSSVTEENAQNTTTKKRIIIWELSSELIMEKPLLGHGTGDVKLELEKKYEQNALEEFYELHLNAHNQFLQTLIALGLFGLVLLLLYLFYPVFHIGFSKNLIFVGFVFLIAINFLAESMLETQAGVVFYAFFNSLLFFNREKS